MIRSQVKRNKNIAGHSEGQAGLTLGVGQGPVTGVYVFPQEPGMEQGQLRADNASVAGDMG